MNLLKTMENIDNNGLEKKENKVGLEVSYGPNRDISRVSNAIKRLPWYAERGYNMASVKIPAGLSESSTQEEITAAVLLEYSETEYEAFKVFIEEKWKEFSKNFEKLKDVPSLNLRDKYTLVLTKYGMGGSYDTEKGEAIVNLSRREKEKTIGVIFHEIVHMTVEHLIQKYQIKHWHKERLVDLMMSKYFPGLTNMQDIKENAAVVDEAFSKFSPDFEAITKAISEKNK